MQATPPAQIPPPRRIFIDTQGWAEIFHAPALHHAQAAEFMQQAQANHWELMTTNLVLSELVALLRSRNFRLPQPQILAIITQLRALPNLVAHHIDRPLDQQARDLLYANVQRPWSHVDATSIVLMRHFGIFEILTADHHFAQAGFILLL